MRRENSEKEEKKKRKENEEENELTLVPVSCPADQLAPLTKTLTALLGERCETVACLFFQRTREDREGKKKR